MKKLNLRLIGKKELEENNGWNIVPAKEGTVGPSSFDNEDSPEDVVKWNSATMTWSRQGSMGHYCVSIVDSEEITENNDD